MGGLSVAWESAVAALVASVACGLAALPVLIRGLNLEPVPARPLPAGWVFAASFYHLLLPALTMEHSDASKWSPTAQTMGGMLLGCVCLWGIQK